MSLQKKVYKYCIVPQCTNTSISTPNKIFVCVPRGETNRKIWCNAIKRDSIKNKPLSSISMRHCCEDHFELEKDVENYQRWKMMGGAIRLKSGVIPHIFDCQRSTIEESKRNTKLKRNCTYKEVSKKPRSSTSTSTSDMAWNDNESSTIEIELNPIDIDKSVNFFGSNKCRVTDKEVQVNRMDLKVSTATQTIICIAPTSIKSKLEKRIDTETEDIIMPVITKIDSIEVKQEPDFFNSDETTKIERINVKEEPVVSDWDDVIKTDSIEVKIKPISCDTNTIEEWR